MGCKVVIGGVTIDRWKSYSVENDLLQPADAFSVALQDPDGSVWSLCRLDEEVEVYIDDVRVLTGYIDDRHAKGSRGLGHAVDISGRDRSGRLVDESMPLMTFDCVGIRQLAEKVVEGVFPAVVLSNVTNRRLIRGKGGRLAPAAHEPAPVPDLQSAGAVAAAAATRAAEIARIARENARWDALGISNEPAIYTGARASKASRRVQPGEKRWQVLDGFLKEAELLAWSTAAGDALVIGLPNYQQAPQYTFRSGAAPLVDWDVKESVAERYSAIIASGTRGGKHSATVKDGTGEFGVGASFIHRKVLWIQDEEIRSPADARRRAEREKAERDAHAQQITLVVSGHSQDGVLYACDTMASVSIPEDEIDGLYLITSVNFANSRDDEKTTIRLAPKGAKLT